VPKLLIIEDDPAIVRAVEKTLTMAEDFSLDWVKEPGKALAAVAALKPDLILLDVRLPGGDGRTLLKALKENARTRAVPVIMLTGVTGEGDKVLGLQLGADDYVSKPFGARELLARIQAVLRRALPERPDAVARAGTLRLDSRSRRAVLDGRELVLQPREFELLFLLAAHAGEALSRQYLIENTSTYGGAVATRSLDTHVKNLRKKLGRRAGMIRTVSKVGYRLDV
jgi:two-component system, OmpR family, phosphate regulon response regulator PhoB